METQRHRPTLLYVGFLLGMAYWLFESALHAWFFHSGTLGETLLGQHDPHEVWMRTLVTLLFTAFGWTAHRLVQSERRERQRVQRLNGLSRYVHQVGHRIQNLVPLGKDEELARLEGSLIEEGEIGKIVQEVQALSRYLDTRIEEFYALLELTHEINKGLLVDEVLERLYQTFHSVIPYDRIGVALLSNDGEVLTSRWTRSDGGASHIPVGYSARMPGSSLQRILQTGEPRIINDLEDYLANHPQSQSSKLIVADGIRSSLTCPLVAVGKPIGFIFFSSRNVGTYQHIHSSIFKLIAGQLAVVIEKSSIYEQLIAEKEKSENLLLNVMPPRIILRLKEGNRSPVEQLQDVGVLFADIVGFTEIAHRYPPQSVLQFLQDFFTQLDLLCEDYGLEKIKTVGDAYMVSTGGEASDSRQLLSLAQFAFDALAAAESCRMPDGAPLRVRIGMHAGPVIAGVIGQKKFAYDLWGDTVNVAHRLESTGCPGRIHVADRVFQMLRDSFPFEARGEIDLKGEGLMATYFMGQTASP